MMTTSDAIISEVKNNITFHNMLQRRENNTCFKTIFMITQMNYSIAASKNNQNIYTTNAKSQLQFTRDG
jgi:hypothetical protein